MRKLTKRLGVVLLVGTLAGCASQGGPKAPPPAAASVPAAGPSTSQLFAEAVTAIAAKDTVTAKARLAEVTRRMPPGWQRERIEQDSVLVTYWDAQEAVACAAGVLIRTGKKRVIQVDEPYVQAWYLTAFVAIEEHDDALAERAIDQALLLDPQRGLLLNEKATILQQRHRLDEAIALNQRTIASSECETEAARKKNLSRAWRSIGVSLIDLRRFDEADTALGESLKVDPGNRATLNELVYLERQRGKNPPEAKPAEVQRVHR